MTGYRLGELNSAGFDRVAKHLEGWCTQAAARSATRTQRVGHAMDAARSGLQGWDGPNADEFKTDVDRLDGELTVIEPVLRDTYEALGELAREATALAVVIRTREEQWAREHWYEQAGSSIVEWVGNRVPFVDHPDASIEIPQMDSWRPLCDSTADRLRRTISALDGVALPPTEARVAGTTPGALPRDRVRHAWSDQNAQAFLSAHKDDKAAIRRWWDGLSPQDKSALFSSRPDLVEYYLRPFLSPSELDEFEHRKRPAASARAVAELPAGPRALYEHCMRTPTNGGPGSAVGLASHCITTAQTAPQPERDGPPPPPRMPPGGSVAYQLDFEISPGGPQDAADLMARLQNDPNRYFPFTVTVSDAPTTPAPPIWPGNMLTLSSRLNYGPGDVRVVESGRQWFRFEAQPGHVGQGGSITFSSYSSEGKVFMKFEAVVAPGSAESWVVPGSEAVGRLTWSKMVAAMKKEYMQTHEW